MGLSHLIEYLRKLVDIGLSSVLLFPSLDSKTKTLSISTNSELNPLLRVASKLKSIFPDLCLIADVCLCTFNETGHCCLLDPNGRIDNRRSVELLTQISIEYAKAGFDIIAPSDMMDNRVESIRIALSTAGFSHISIMSYSAKFESCFYGPFRDAAGSAPQFGDRKCYQLPPGSRGLALRAVERDIQQGASMVMVKPAMTYLDIVQSISTHYPNVPIAVYQVSGEYTMLIESAKSGAFDLKRVVIETLTSFKRSGASIIITYFTPHILEWLKNGQL